MSSEMLEKRRSLVAAQRQKMHKESRKREKANDIEVFDRFGMLSYSVSAQSHSQQDNLKFKYECCLKWIRIRRNAREYRNDRVCSATEMFV